MLIGESTPAKVTSTGQDKWNEWYRPFFDLIHKYPNIKGVSYINRNWNVSRWNWGDGQIQSDATLLQNYIKELQGGPYVLAQQPMPGRLSISEPVFATYRTLDHQHPLSLTLEPQAASLGVFVFSYDLQGAASADITIESNGKILESINCVSSSYHRVVLVHLPAHLKDITLRIDKQSPASITIDDGSQENGMAPLWLTAGRKP